jgi:hypothetical protein
MPGPVNRKELTRQYKETRRPMGIFCVRNTSNGKMLVGSSVDLPSRLNRERAQLRLGAHPNPILQTDWNTLGSESFVFEALDTLVPPDGIEYDPTFELGVLEQLWLDKLMPFGERGYNVKPDNSK